MKSWVNGYCLIKDFMIVIVDIWWLLFMFVVNLLSMIGVLDKLD